MTPSAEMMDYLIRAETLSYSFEIAGEKISEKLIVCVVLEGVPDTHGCFRTMHGFSKTPNPFVDLKKALKNFSDSQNVKDCGHSSNTKSNAALFVSRDNVKKFSGECFQCYKNEHVKTLCTVNICSICNEFGHSEFECFQVSKLDKKSENETHFSQSSKFFSYWGSDSSKNEALILDSRYTSHLFCEIDFLLNLMLIIRKMFNDNDSVSPVKGKNFAKIFLLDERSVFHVLILSD